MSNNATLQRRPLVKKILESADDNLLVIAGLGFVVELDFLNPRAELKQYDVFSLLHYDK